MFIAFDGLDGAGKSSLCQQVFQTLKSENYVTSYHAIGHLGYCDEEFEQLKKGELLCSSEIRELLYYFEILLYYNRNVSKFHSKGKEIMIFDRYLLSYFSYGPLNGISIARVKELLSELPWPDLYFFVDIKPEIALARIKSYRKLDAAEIGYKNHENCKEISDTNFISHQRKIRSLFYDQINNEKTKNIYILDGSQPLEQLCQFCIKTILQYLKVKI